MAFSTKRPRRYRWCSDARLNIMRNPDNTNQTVSVGVALEGPFFGRWVDVARAQRVGSSKRRKAKRRVIKALRRSPLGQNWPIHGFRQMTARLRRRFNYAIRSRRRKRYTSREVFRQVLCPLRGAVLTDIACCPLDCAPSWYASLQVGAAVLYPQGGPHSSGLFMGQREVGLQLTVDVTQALLDGNILVVGAPGEEE